MERWIVVAEHDGVDAPINVGYHRESSIIGYQVRGIAGGGAELIARTTVGETVLRRYGFPITVEHVDHYVIDELIQSEWEIDAIQFLVPTHEALVDLLARLEPWELDERREEVF